MQPRVGTLNLILTISSTEVKGPMGISKEMSPSKIPGVAGNVGSSATTEIGNKILEKGVEKLKTQKDE